MWKPKVSEVKVISIYIVGFNFLLGICLQPYFTNKNYAFDNLIKYNFTELLIQLHFCLFAPLAKQEKNFGKGFIFTCGWNVFDQKFFNSHTSNW